MGISGYPLKTQCNSYNDIENAGDGTVDTMVLPLNDCTSRDGTVLDATERQHEMMHDDVPQYTADIPTPRGKPCREDCTLPARGTDYLR